MDVEYALVTSSALPSKVKESDYFMEVDEAQWEDLVEYSKTLEERSDKEKVMVLIVAHGTPEQEEEERKRIEAEEKALQDLRDEEYQKARAEVEEEYKSKEIKELEAEVEESKKQERIDNRLRARSKEIMNALYGR